MHKLTNICTVTSLPLLSQVESFFRDFRRMEIFYLRYLRHMLMIYAKNYFLASFLLDFVSLKREALPEFFIFSGCIATLI